MEFQADIVTFEPCDDGFIAYAFFRSRNASDERYLVISRCLEPGMKVMWLWNSTIGSRSTTDGILEWNLDEHRLTLNLESRAAKDIGIVGSPGIIVEFTMTRDSLEGLQRILSAIFGKRPKPTDR